MLTRKYYKMIAKAIKDNTIYNTKGCKALLNGDEVLDKDNLLNDICIEFKKDNSLFNSDTFKDACND